MTDQQITETPQDDGWSNHESRLTFTYFNNDRDGYEALQAMMSHAAATAPTHEHVITGSWTVERAERNILADLLKQHMQSMSMAETVLGAAYINAALARVNWKEIAGQVKDFGHLEEQQ